MRVLLQADMDGVATIADHRELVTWWPQYWSIGRAKFLAEVQAAIAGLLEGGADAVDLYDGHGSGALNFDPGQLPAGTRLVPVAGLHEYLRDASIDAVFQVGRHPRTGTNDGFIPHTQNLGLALAIDGRPITECHLLAYSAGVPLLGIVGDAKLAPQIDGELAGTPFLATKRGVSKGHAVPLHADPAAGNAAIHAFARECAANWRERPTPTLPPSFTFSACLLDSALTESAVGQAGLRRESASVLSTTCRDWNTDAVPAMYAAMGAIGKSMGERIAGLSVPTEAAIDEADPRLATARAIFDDWLERTDNTWQV